MPKDVAVKLPEWASPNIGRFVVTEKLIEITPTHFKTQNGESKNSYSKQYYQLAEQERFAEVSNELEEVT